MPSPAHAAPLSPTAKMAAAAKNAPAESKGASSKMHRRSRSGCFTCRLRRKKCEEGKPACRACRHLGLQCNYKRPMWWSNSDSRRAQKEQIKNVIKRTQLSKKAAQVHEQQQPQPSAAPPNLCHAMPPPPPVEFFADSMPQSRRQSIVSPFSSLDFPHLSPDGYFEMPPPPQPILQHPQYPMFSPYEIDIKTERQIYVNDVPTRRDSTISTFSTYQPPPLSDGMPAFPADSWVQQEHHESLQESFTEEPVDFNFFQFPNGLISPNHETVINVEDCDKYLLDHFLDKVLKLIFPVLDANQHGSARDLILPALERNQAYLHCCLSIAAMHKKSTECLSGEQIDSDILRHQWSAVSELCRTLNEGTDSEGTLGATLAMIFFHCSVGRSNDILSDVTWYQHFEMVTSLVMNLGLPTTVLSIAETSCVKPSFDMTLTSWIDILGSTMLGRSPTFSDTYRELNLRNGGIGLAELMGCDDKIMFLISEMACLDWQKTEGLITEIVLCNYVKILAEKIGTIEPPPGAVQSCFSSTGAIRPKQLTTNITAVFSVAARIYLVALVPGFEPRQLSMQHLISRFSDFMNFIPAGPDGFDRSVVWPLLVAGSVSISGSPFRSMFAERCDRLGDAANLGSFGRIREILHDIWHVNDTAAAGGEYQGVHWRDVMHQKGWDHLLI